MAYVPGRLQKCVRAVLAAAGVSPDQRTQDDRDHARQLPQRELDCADADEVEVASLDGAFVEGLSADGDRCSGGQVCGERDHG